MRAITRSRENSYGSGAAKFTFPCSARKMNMCFSDTRASPEKLLYKPQIFASVVGLDTFWTLRLQPVYPADACCSMFNLLVAYGPCIYSVDPRGGRWAGTKTPPFGGVRSIYLDTENIQNQTPARICMHRKVSFFRSMKLTRNRSFILLKIQRQFLRVFACNQQKFLLTQNHVHDAVPAQWPKI